MSTKHVFIIDAGTDYLFSKGQLNHSLADLAVEVLQAGGCKTRLTRVEDGYGIDPEIDNFLWADVVIYQQPAWWMGAPWTLKKYLDEVLTCGQGKLYANDGRTRSDETKYYGSGGLMLHTKYMISCTWNAPVEAFADQQQFFEGKGMDAVYFSFHKMNQFLGMRALPTFSCHDVIKEPHIDKDFLRYRQHLKHYVCGPGQVL